MELSLRGSIYDHTAWVRFTCLICLQKCVKLYAKDTNLNSRKMLLRNHESSRFKLNENCTITETRFNSNGNKIFLNDRFMNLNAKKRI